MIIDDRPYIPDPGELGNIIYVTAQKRGKNGNVKKRIAAEPECEVVEHEREFLKIVKKMMK